MAIRRIEITPRRIIVQGDDGERIYRDQSLVPILMPAIESALEEIDVSTAVNLEVDNLKKAIKSSGDSLLLIDHNLKELDKASFKEEMRSKIRNRLVGERVNQKSVKSFSELTSRILAFCEATLKEFNLW